MTLAVRVIACLDVHDGRVVKGIGFRDLVDAGDPVALAARYDALGIDELAFLDVTASHEGRATTLDAVRRTAQQVFIPLTVGGGVRSARDVDELLRAGADKVSVGTAAVERPGLIAEIADTFGSQVLVLSVDAVRSPEMPSGYEVTARGGRQRTGLDAVQWARQAADSGAGEILLNGMDADGTRQGYDLRLIRAVRRAVTVPLIASGGAGSAVDFPPAVEAGADALLAASVFHFGTLSVADVKEALARSGYVVRPVAPRRVAQPADGWLDLVAYNADGLVPGIAQDVSTGRVLMLAWLDDVALGRTIESGLATYWSRSRQQYWVKGAMSGNVQRVREIRLDCDGDTLLLLVEQTGPACHTGAVTCFDA